MSKHKLGMYVHREIWTTSLANSCVAFLKFPVISLLYSGFLDTLFPNLYVHLTKSLSSKHEYISPLHTSYGRIGRYSCLIGLIGVTFTYVTFLILSFRLWNPCLDLNLPSIFWKIIKFTSKEAERIGIFTGWIKHMFFFHKGR